MSTYIGLFLLSAASLAFEIDLTRIFSVAQFYHFAFMVVSLALLGFGASGTLLSLAPRLSQGAPSKLLTRLGWGFSVAAIGAYMLTLHVPFDSYRVAHEWAHAGVLMLHYLALAAPFFCSGTAVGLLLAAWPKRVNWVYTANLAGSAAGCVLAVLTPSLVGGEGTVLVCAALAIAAALAFQYQHPDAAQPHGALSRADDRPYLASGFPRVAQGALILLLVLAALRTPSFLQIRLSPYKGLSQALLAPDARVILSRWNGFSRVDVVRSESIRSLPGSGFRCSAQPPPQMGLTVDGDDLTTINHVEPGFTDLAFTDCLLGALPYQLRPQADALVLEPRGGFDVVTALAQRAAKATVVESNPLVVQAVRSQGDWAGQLYEDPRVRLVIESGRTFARRTQEQYDVVTLSLNVPQRTVTSGAYSLNEDYRYTVQAFSDYLARLKPGGLLAVTRWIQVPPSESIRAFALAVEAVERAGGVPKASIAALRSYQQVIILVREGAFTAGERAAIRSFARQRAFDLVYLPDIQPDEVNLHNVLPEPDYYRACVGLLDAKDRDAWYDGYEFDVRPPTDDRPFFGHFFRWEQMDEVLTMAGHTWQPFGGAGYLVMLIVLAFAAVAVGALILVPVAPLRHRGGPMGSTVAYFALLGLGYLFVEIPLMQRFIVFLGHPAYAMATVLFALLLFSGLGSAVSHRVSLTATLVLLPLLVGVYALGLPGLFEVTLAAPLWARVIVAVVALAAPGFLMGIPLPKGMARLEGESAGLIPWAWGVNGGVSVVASILAALLGLSWGFSAVLALGSLCYAAALIAAPSLRAHHSIGGPAQ